MRMQVPSLALLSGLRIPLLWAVGVGHRHGSGLTWLWLWHRPEAPAPLGPLAWEPPYAAGVALKDKKTTTTKELSNEIGWVINAQNAFPAHSYLKNMLETVVLVSCPFFSLWTDIILVAETPVSTVCFYLTGQGGLLTQPVVCFLPPAGVREMMI